jgi:ATP-binding cassette subfamily C (CFTR/MRP) protein 1
MAFCHQNPWLFQGSLVENIIMNRPFEQDWFSIVLWACCLDDTIEQLSNGIHSMVGEDGNSLSGGQKARVVGFDTDLVLSWLT